MGTGSGLGHDSGQDRCTAHVTVGLQGCVQLLIGSKGQDFHEAGEGVWSLFGDFFWAEGTSAGSRTGMPECVCIKAMVIKRPRNMVTYRREKFVSPSC